MSSELESVKETAIATQEVAKTASNAIDAGREFGSFVSRFISAPLEQGVGILEDRLRFMRWERQIRLIERAKELIEMQGLGEPDTPIALKTAVPLLEYATLEEDDNLQDMWAQLLVNGTRSCSGVSLERAFIEILSQLSTLEAQILRTIYALPFENTQHNGVLTASLPDAAEVFEQEPEGGNIEPNDRVKIALANLVRLGCLKAAFTWGGGESFSKVNPTVIGKEFVRACSNP
ncbi:Abi-alpha family protein [Vibrio vulnificus]|uniref:Abi-alpha family protein n=1 Tax=Vibrio TaxID=662 RepID=UPI000FE2BAB1|nr:Abi-alpha family protein [Vibrio vulnificus]MDS1873218.1 Abi-alpha family protein [Vibrio vulnificus]